MTLIIIGLLIFTGIVVFRPHYGIYLVLLLLPSYQVRFEIIGLPTTFLEWLILILTGITIIKALAGKNFRSKLSVRLKNFASQNKMFVIFSVLFIFASGISIFISPELSKALGLWRAYIFEAMLFGLLFYLLIDTKEKLAQSFNALGLLVAGLALFGLYQFFTLYRLPTAWWGPGEEPRRVVSLYTYPNAVSLLVAPILAMFAAILALWKKLPEQFSKKFVIAVLILGLLLLILTFSRGAWIGFSAAVVLVSLFTEHRKTVASLLVASALLILLVPVTRARLLPIFTGTDPASQERILLYKGAWEIIKDKPFLGAGLYGFRRAYEQVRVSETDEILNYPHNFFLNFWIETGLFGLISILVILALLLKRGVVQLRESREAQSLIFAVFAAITVILVHGQFDAPYFKNDLAVLFWMFLAMLLCSFELYKYDRGGGI